MSIDISENISYICKDFSKIQNINIYKSLDIKNFNKKNYSYYFCQDFLLFFRKVNSKIEINIFTDKSTKNFPYGLN